MFNKNIVLLGKCQREQPASMFSQQETSWILTICVNLAPPQKIKLYFTLFLKTEILATKLSVTNGKERKHAFQNKTKVDVPVFNTVHNKRSWFHTLFKYFGSKNDMITNPV